MKKAGLAILVWGGCVVFPVLAAAQVDVRISVPVPLPPPIRFVAPPAVVVLPGTDVYAVPDVDAEIFFRGGWWWRHWEGRWYRSKYYDHGWAHYRGYPSWHRKVPRDWRVYYRDHRWGGHPWHPRHVRPGDLHRHWKGGHWRHDPGWRHPGGPGGGRPPRHGGGPGGHDSLHRGGVGGGNPPGGGRTHADLRRHPVPLGGGDGR